MHARAPVVVVVRPGSSPRRTAVIARWVRKLLPAAYLLVAPVAILPDPGPDAITLDADEIVSGPLSLASQLVRHVERVSD
jgi:hypothetical protein